MRRLAAMAAVGLVAGCGSADTSGGATNRGTDAWVICEKFAERHLDMNDIEFGGRDATTIKGTENGPYTVTSTFATGGEPVDYTCKVKYHPEDENEWELVDFTTGW